MLNQNQYILYNEIHKPSPFVRNYIDLTRAGQGSRQPGAFATKNITCALSSTKMSRTITVESRGPERSFAIYCEYDNNIKEFWNQPEPIEVIRHNKHGTPIRKPYTPDFLVLTNNGPKLIEVKPLKAVIKLIEEKPLDWQQDGATYRFLPAELKCNEMGIPFEVWIYESEHQYKVSNYELLITSRDAPQFEVGLSERCRCLFWDKYYWSMLELKQRLNLDSYVPLLQLIDQGYLFTDLSGKLLSEPDSCILTMDNDLLENAIKASSQLGTYLGAAEGGIGLSLVPKEAEAKKALSRLKQIDTGENNRSIRRWKKQIKDGQEKDLSAFQALLPKTYLRGNRSNKLLTAVSDFLENYILTKHSKSQGLNKTQSYYSYINLARKLQPEFTPVSLMTFSNRIKFNYDQQVAAGRGGKRLANSVSEPTDPLQRHLKPSIPWQAVAIDHYLVDLYLICFKNGKDVVVDRPQLTAMIDLATKKILAVSISFLPPSRRSVSKVLRECVRKHGRLPREIILDRGSDFKSVYTESILAHYGIIYSMRPPSLPRMGGEIENFFKNFIKEYLSRRPGNLADFKEARSIDGKLAPKNKAVLTIEDLYREINFYINFSAQKPQNGNISSSIDEFEQGIKDFPCMAIPVTFDQDFLIATSIDSKKYRIDFQRGVSIGEAWYWSPKLMSLKGKEKSVEIRIDPENHKVVYGAIENHWEQLHASDINRYQTLSVEKQLSESLIALEAISYRNHLRKEHGITLAAASDGFDDKLSAPPEIVEPTSINIIPLSTELEKLDFSMARKLESSEWSQAHE
ncbi:MAG: DDE-type integrase/transposase/recombinase [Oleispira sp.]